MFSGICTVTWTPFETLRPQYGPLSCFGHPHETHSDKAWLKKLRKLLEKQCGGVCIVYTNTEDTARFVYQQINEWHPGEVVMYCGSSRHHERKPAVSKLLNDKYRIIVTTCTVKKDKKNTDVRLIVHLSIPMSIPDYLRQTEKFCNSKKGTKRVLMYSDSDFYDNKITLQHMRDRAEQAEKPFDYSAKLSELAAMSDYIGSSQKLQNTEEARNYSRNMIYNRCMARQRIPRTGRQR